MVSCVLQQERLHVFWGEQGYVAGPKCGTRAIWRSPAEPVDRLFQGTTGPLNRNPTNGTVFELLGMSNSVTDFAVIVDPASKKIMEQARTHLLELFNHRLRLRNRLVDEVEDRSDASLLRGIDPWDTEVVEEISLDPLLTCGSPMKPSARVRSSFD